ncbi:MAG: VWA domain-containing protein [Phycisphaerae bacterium]|nr:VWA domain-containing protein [Saprospiraceae bacterium]
MATFYFESPYLLYLLGIVPLQALLLWAYWRWRQQTLRRLGSPALEERLLQGFSIQRFWGKNLMFVGGLALVIIAIASPVRIEKEEDKMQNSADVVIALDISNSMLATDVKPSRLEQAKSFIQRLAPALDGERLGLVFFAGEAFPQMPLSTDFEALLMFARNAQPDFITDQGTDIGAAIESCKRILETDAETGRAIVLISDGENHEEKILQRVREAYEAGVVIYTVGVGSAGGASIPSGKGELRRDGMGKPVRSSANESLMQSLAESGGGEALNLRDPDRALSTIKSAVSRLQKSAVMANATSKKIYYFPWVLLAALLLLISEQVMQWKKKGVSTAIVLLLAGYLSAQSEHSALRQGERYYDKGDYEKAQEAYQKSKSSAARYNAGNAAYLQSEYAEAAQFFREAAEKSLSPADKSNALYNLGNACLLQGDYRAAIEAYERSLRLVPKRPDAQKNLQIAKRKLQEPPPPPQSPPPPPPPPPPPSVRPRQNYLDQASPSRKKEIPPTNLPADTARRLLNEAVLSEEQKNAGAYRELAPANRPSRLKKDW